ncbi:MAG TPA: RES family NAD+ phosphorylase [Bryobacteraceae bacterium]|nr:RES family NAD+ phosphorylase [Bryobacteraceae bacterium]
MILWRISNYADLLGIGGLEASARWHTAGRPIVYLAESPSAALLEILVHLETDEEDRPGSYQILKIEVSEGVAAESVPLASLPPGWRSNESTTREIGDAWLAKSASALLRVPSVITPETYNWLLNPRHADAKKIMIVHVENHPYDSRLPRSHIKLTS